MTMSPERDTTNTSMRRVDVTHIRRCDVDLVNRVLEHVRRSKNEARHRVIPLNGSDIELWCAFSTAAISTFHLRASRSGGQVGASAGHLAVSRARCPRERRRMKEHAWKWIPPTHADAHQVLATQFPSTTCRNSDVHRRVLVNHAVRRGFHGYLTQL
jgi:hypothetical protein